MKREIQQILQKELMQIERLASAKQDRDIGYEPVGQICRDMQKLVRIIPDLTIHQLYGAFLYEMPALVDPTYWCEFDRLMEMMEQGSDDEAC